MPRLATHLARHAAAVPLALSAIVSPMRAQTTHPTPAPIFLAEWGLAADSVIRRVTQSGWTFVTVDEDSDYVFRGIVDGVEAVAFASFAQDRLTTLQINLSPHMGASRTYAEVLDTLAAVNGPALYSSESNREYHPSASLRAAAAWKGILTGFRRDGWITIVFTSPESSPRLPPPKVRLAST